MILSDIAVSLTFFYTFSVRFVKCMNCKHDDRKSFENALVVKERKLNYFKKHGLVKRNVVLICY